MIDYPALATKFMQTMEANGHTAKQVSQQWGISVMTVTNIKKGNTLSAEMLCKVCLYTGDNPLFFWRDTSVNYDNGVF